MDRGTYAASSAGMVALRRLDIANNNVANINTPGFKRQLLVSRAREFDETLARFVENAAPFARGDNERTPSSVSVQAVTDFTLGPIQTTGEKMDVALGNENQFFVLQTPEGDRYTRAGNFTLNGEGKVVSQDGFIVKSTSGEITVRGAGAEISSNGTVRAEGVSAGRILVVEFPNTEGLVREAGARFALPIGADAPEEAESPSIIAGALEQANVSTFKSITELISVNRAFEFYAKAAQTIDRMNEQAISKVGSK